MLSTFCLHLLYLNLFLLMKVAVFTEAERFYAIYVHFREVNLGIRICEEHRTGILNNAVTTHGIIFFASPELKTY